MKKILLICAFLSLPLAAADDAIECAVYVLEEDYQSALPVCTRAAEQGEADVQRNLGAVYLNIGGAEKNKREAVKWLRKAAEQEDVYAQFFLGFMYFTGTGIKQDKQEAAKWFRKADQWYRKAATSYRKAAEQGDSDSQGGLGLMYFTGVGVKQDKRESAKWFRKAAENGEAGAQIFLGLMYSAGQGVIEDIQEAYIWFSLAAITGKENAVELKELAAESLTTSQINAANREAKKRLQEIDRRVNENDTDQSQPALYQSTNAAPSVLTPAETAFENGWRSVVVIKTDDGQGSGVIIRPNLIATNCHVVDNGDDIIVYKADNRRAEIDSAHIAFIRNTDNNKDLCLLNVPGLWGIPANIRRADSLRVGESVYAIGAPEGLDYSLSAGVVSQLRSENGEAPIIQTDAAISPGSSGGGLFDSQGNLVGITTEKILPERGAEGLSFAIPADWVLDLQN